MLIKHSTLTQFLIEERRRYPDAKGDFNSLILNLATAGKAISKRVRNGALGEYLTDAEGDEFILESDLRRWFENQAMEIFRRANEWSGEIAGLSFANEVTPTPLSGSYPLGKYLLVVDSLTDSRNIDVDGTLGSLFSILRSPNPEADPDPVDFLQPGAAQIGAGYILYGPATLLVITVGTGVHGFTLDPTLGEFFLTHPRIRIPPVTRNLAVNSAGKRSWEPAVEKYFDECLDGADGTRGEDFRIRWVASLAAATHRILMRGGVLMYPKDAGDATSNGGLQLLHDACPVAFIVEQAGGGASDGRGRLLEVEPESLDQRTGLFVGSSKEVERIEQYHRDFNQVEYNAPLFGRRGLFRGSA